VLKQEFCVLYVLFSRPVSGAVKAKRFHVGWICSLDGETGYELKILMGIPLGQ
jgi:hypothetical protein